MSHLTLADLTLLPLTGALHVRGDNDNPAPVNCGAVSADGDVTATGYCVAQQGVLIGTFRVPQTPLPYQSDPTAASLRDALVAAGYMAAEEI